MRSANCNCFGRSRLAGVGSHQDRRGIAASEFAMILPLLMVMFLGLVEVAQAMNVCQNLTAAARDASRIAAKSGSTNAAVINQINDRLSRSLGLNSEDFTVSIRIYPATGNDNPYNDLASASQRDVCEIKIQLDFGKVSFLRTASVLEGFMVQGQAAMRHE